MKNMKRAVRRHHRQRLIKKVSKYFICQDRYILSKEFAALIYNNPKVCSCWICSNQRRVEGDSIQEIKAKAIDKEEQ